MIIDQSIAQIYARAVFNVAKERGTQEALRAEIDSLAELMETKTGRRLQEFWNSPAILTSDKLAMVEKAFQSRISDLLKNLARLLISKLRVEHLTLVLAELKRLSDEERGLKPGIVATALEIGPQTRDALRAALEKKVGCGLALEFHVRPALLGGVVFQFGDELYDDSVRTKLDRLRSRLLASALPHAA